MTEKDQWIEDFIRTRFICGSTNRTRLIPILRDVLERAYPHIKLHWQSLKGFYVILADKSICLSPPLGGLNAHEIILSARVLELSDTGIKGVLAHELGHWYLQGYSEHFDDDDGADKLAQRWGFGEELKASRTRS